MKPWPQLARFHEPPAALAKLSRADLETLRRAVSPS
jgi:hypothetical protein